MEKVKILWSGITGKTGKEALNAVKESDFAEIVSGICRSDSHFYHYDELDKIKEDFDVIVDFSHKDSFNQILEFALKMKKPIIIGTSGLTNEQIKAFENISNIIPVFRGGNFRFDVKTFIDHVIEYAKKCPDKHIKLVENHYKTVPIPSETAKVIEKRVMHDTNKQIEIQSFSQDKENTNDWKVGDLHYHCDAYDQNLAMDILNIAMMMKNKEPNGVYDLDRLLLENDQKYMDIAIECSKKANYPYGAVIVKNHQIIGRSDHFPPISKTAFSHAELRAIEDAMDQLGGYLCAEGGKGATIYSSCEPCAMCMGAILYTGIDRLVYGATLEDSKECVNDIMAKAIDVSHICFNRNIEIVSEFERVEAIKILKKWKESQK